VGKWGEDYPHSRKESTEGAKNFPQMKSRARSLEGQSRYQQKKGELAGEGKERSPE